MNSAIVHDVIEAPPSSRKPPRETHRAETPRLDAERRFLFGLCYRMTGSASDAEDLVQETFVRALERPPADLDKPLRPWLVRVAMNLAKDELRRRKRRSYTGLWLPAPIETQDESDALGEPLHAESPESRYGLMESASYAFLVALEALGPTQRAVLLLRDAFDCSSRETADTLAMSEENVRITLHRARRAMATYDRERHGRAADLPERTESVVHRLLACFATRDVAAAQALLASDARSLGDGGGVYHAARKPVVGAEKITKLYMNLAGRSSSEAKVEVRRVNGLPAVIGVDPDPKPPAAPRFVLLLDVDTAGRVRSLYSVIAPDKLGRIAWPPARISSPTG
jgi:RNA polymerase sigma-70 factor (ECF subfamily)